MTTQQILDLNLKDFLKLSEPELRKITQQIADTANKRLKRLEQNDMYKYSSAYTHYQETNPNNERFTTKYKNLNGLRGEYRKIKNFLSNETSTIRGIKKSRSKSVNALGEIFASAANNKVSFDDFSKQLKDNPELFDKFWKSYSKLSELNPFISSKKYKYETLQSMVEYMQDNPDDSLDNIVETMNTKINSIYEKTQRAFDSVADFFSID